MSYVMTREEYGELMSQCGFMNHEIEECWESSDRLEILEAAITDGDRDLSPGD